MTTYVSCDTIYDITTLISHSFGGISNIVKYETIKYKYYTSVIGAK